MWMGHLIGDGLFFLHYFWLRQKQSNKQMKRNKLRFEHIKEDSTWRVVVAASDYEIGIIKYKQQWKRFVFSSTGCVLDASSMREIIEFISNSSH